MSKPCLFVWNMLVNQTISVMHRAPIARLGMALRDIRCIAWTDRNATSLGTMQESVE